MMLRHEEWCAADIHSLLADIGMEQENFESAMQDHKHALELLSTILQVCITICTCLHNNQHDNNKTVVINITTILLITIIVIIMMVIMMIIVMTYIKCNNNNNNNPKNKVFRATHFHICMLRWPLHCHMLLCYMQCQHLYCYSCMQCQPSSVNLYVLSHVHVLQQLCCWFFCPDLVQAVQPCKICVSFFLPS